MQLIKKLETDRDLMLEDVRHMKKQQEILSKGKKSVPTLDYSKTYKLINKSNKVNNDENEFRFHEVGG